MRARKYNFTCGRVTHDGMCDVGTYMGRNPIGTNSDTAEYTSFRMEVLHGDNSACATYHIVQPTLNKQLQFQDIYFYYEL